ncbi:MAG: hypothetical protein ACRC8W_13585 [Plesiomonas shigelloides]
MEKLYTKRDLPELDLRGGFYTRHVEAMTKEGLDSKSDIAAELAIRDLMISNLHFHMQQLRDQISDLSENTADAERYRWLRDYHCGNDAVALNMETPFDTMDEAIDYMIGNE